MVNRGIGALWVIGVWPAEVAAGLRFDVRHVSPRTEMLNLYSYPSWLASRNCD